MATRVKRASARKRPPPSVAPPEGAHTRRASQAEPAAGQDRRTASREPHVTIVGIGASAGGLAAFEAFLSAMPANTRPGMSFVLVQHLAPDHKSILSELIQRYTAMTVFEVEDGMRIKPNCAYIIPPNCDLGGMVMAQTPESTEYDGMPRSVITTGLADNLLAGTGMGTVFVDLQLRIQRFTPASTQVINLIKTDLGRPVGHLASNLSGYDSLVADIQAVLDTLTLKELQQSEALRRLAVVVRDSHDAILGQALDGRILAWNPGAVKTYGWTEAEALAMNIRELIPEVERDVALSKVHELAGAAVLAPSRAQQIAKGGAVVDVWLTAAALVDGHGAAYAIATTERAVGTAIP